MSRNFGCVTRDWNNTTPSELLKQAGKGILLWNIAQKSNFVQRKIIQIADFDSDERGSHSDNKNN